MPRRSALDYYQPDSYLGPCVLPATTDEEIGVLEGNMSHWMAVLEESKWPLALHWFTNLAFLMGNQYIGLLWNGVEMQLDNGPAAISLPQQAHLDIPKVVANRLIRPFQQMVSLLTQSRPEPQVEPNSDSPSDKDAAEIGALYLDRQWTRNRIQNMLRGVGAHLGIEGTTSIETVWAETEIPVQIQKFRTRKTKDAITDEEIEVEEPAGTEWSYRKGLIQTLWNAYQIQPDPGATDDPESLSWMTRSCFADIGQVREMFDRDDEGYMPDRLADIPEAQGASSPLYWYERIKELLEAPELVTSYATRMGAHVGGFAPGQTILRYWDCKPTRWFPEGRTLVTAGGKLIYAGKARVNYAGQDRYEGRWNPHRIFRYWRIPGRFWAMPLLSQLLPLQKRLNACYSLMQLNRELVAIGQWLNPKQANVPESYLGGIPATVIPYTATASNAKPERVENQPFPEIIVREIEICEREIEHISVTENYLTGQAPSAIRSGNMLDLLHRRSREAQSPIVQDFGEALEGVSEDMLIETSMNMTEEDERLTRELRAMAREKSPIAIAAFTGAVLLDNHRVRIDLGSSFLKTPEAKQERAQAVMQFMGNELSQAERGKIYEVLDLDEFGLEDSSDLRRAQRMVSLLVDEGDPQQLIIMPQVDNPAIFVQVFKREIQSDRMYTYPRKVQMALQVFHMEYAKLLQAQQQAMLAQQLGIMRQEKQMDAQVKAAGRPPDRKAA